MGRVGKEDRERRVNLSREGREKRTGPKGSKPRKIQRGSADSIGGKRTRGPSDRIEAARAPRYSQCGAVTASSSARSFHAAAVANVLLASRYRDHDRQRLRLRLLGRSACAWIIDHARQSSIVFRACCYSLPAKEREREC